MRVLTLFVSLRRPNDGGFFIPVGLHKNSPYTNISEFSEAETDMR